MKSIAVLILLKCYKMFQGEGTAVCYVSNDSQYIIERRSLNEVSLRTEASELL